MVISIVTSTVQKIHVETCAPDVAAPDRLTAATRLSGEDLPVVGMDNEPHLLTGYGRVRHRPTLTQRWISLQ